MSQFEGEGLLVMKAKDSVAAEGITRDSSTYTIKQAYTDVTSLPLGDDVCRISNYTKTRLATNDVIDIMEMSGKATPPSAYALLQRAQPTPSSVERSFSMLQKLLAKDRNFNPENVQHYLSVRYNYQEDTVYVAISKCHILFACNIVNYLHIVNT